MAFLNVALLALLVAADEQQDDGFAALHETDAIAWAEVDAQFPEAVEILYIAEEPGLNAGYPLSDLLLALFSASRSSHSSNSCVYRTSSMCEM